MLTGATQSLCNTLPSLTVGKANVRGKELLSLQRQMQVPVHDPQSHQKLQLQGPCSNRLENKFFNTRDIFVIIVVILLFIIIVIYDYYWLLLFCGGYFDCI